MPRLDRLAWGLATFALCAGVAYAQQPVSGGNSKEQAAKLAAEAEALGKKQQFADALNRYKEAARLDPDTAAYQCNIGMAYYALGDEARAHLYFGRCHRANGGWPANVEDVFNYVVGVLGKEDFTPLKISGTPANAEVIITLYAEEGPLVAPVTVYVPFSNYEVQIRADGYETKNIPIEANSRGEKSLVYSLAAAQKTGESDPGPAGPASGADNLNGSEGDVSGQVDTGGGRKKWPLVLAAGGGVAAVGGFLAFRSARNKQEDLCQLTDDPGNCDAPLLEEFATQAEDLKSAMRTREVIAYSLFGVGAAAIGAGLVLYFMQPEEGQSSSMAVSAAPASGGGMVFFSFTR